MLTLRQQGAQRPPLGIFFFWMTQLLTTNECKPGATGGSEARELKKAQACAGVPTQLCSRPQ